MNVTLLGETGATTEGGIERFAVDEELALDLADSLPLRDRVEERSLSGTWRIISQKLYVLRLAKRGLTRGTHESGEHARLDESCDAVEKNFVLAVDLHGIANVLRESMISDVYTCYGMMELTLKVNTGAFSSLRCCSFFSASAWRVRMRSALTCEV